MSAVLKGNTVAGGAAAGRAIVLPAIPAMVATRELREEQVPEELARFDAALEQSAEQIRGLVEDAGLAPEYRAIFEAHLLMLEDPMLAQGTRDAVRERRVNCERALSDILAEFKAAMEKLHSAEFRERAADLEDVANRVLSNLMEVPEGDVRVPFVRGLARDHVLIADEISPSLMLYIHGIAGLAVSRGGVTGHMAILARNREIPTIVGVKDLLGSVSSEQEVLLDADQGLLITDPDAKTLEDYTYRLRAYGREPEVIRPAYGEISLWANLNEEEDLEDERVRDVSGVGLFRTEFLYFKNPELFVSADEQAKVYQRVLAGMDGRMTIFRLLDLGDDKQIAGAPGMVGGAARGVRFLLANRELFRTQIRALLMARRAAGTGAKNMGIMLPMPATLEEIHVFREKVARINGEIAPGEELPALGVMIETPAAAMMADVFSPHLDFLSIGTNDLAAQMLGVRREAVNARSELFHQPSLYRMLARVVEDAGIPLSVCGEIAGEPELVPVLAGLGIRRLSVGRGALNRTARVLRELDLESAREKARRVLEAPDAGAVREITESGVRER